jgi:uncharacterized membrane protein YdjX (TVP38/TMEM64 family)
VHTRLTSENFIGLYLWFALIVAALVAYFFHPEVFAPASIQRFFAANLVLGLGIYFVLSVVRGFLLIPLTPLLLAGILVFPPLPLFLVTLAGIWFSSALIYWLSRQLRLDQFFRRHYSRQLDRLTALLNKAELPVILLWSFAPFTPTDLIVYVCSVLHISAWKTLTGVLVGEAAICAVYIFGGAAGLALLNGTL